MNTSASRLLGYRSSPTASDLNSAVQLSLVQSAPFSQHYGKETWKTIEFKSSILSWKFLTFGEDLDVARNQSSQQESQAVTIQKSTGKAMLLVDLQSSKGWSSCGETPPLAIWQQLQRITSPPSLTQDSGWGTLLLDGFCCLGPEPLGVALRQGTCQSHDHVTHVRSFFYYPWTTKGFSVHFSYCTQMNQITSCHVRLLYWLVGHSYMSLSLSSWTEVENNKFQIIVIYSGWWFKGMKLRNTSQLLYHPKKDTNIARC